MKKSTPLQIEKRSAEDAVFMMLRPDIHPVSNRVFALGLLLSIVLLSALGCLIGRQADKQLAEVPYVMESSPSSSQMERDDPQVERFERAWFVLNEMDRLWSTPPK